MGHRVQISNHLYEWRISRHLCSYDFLSKYWLLHLPFESSNGMRALREWRRWSTLQWNFFLNYTIKCRLILATKAIRFEPNFAFGVLIPVACCVHFLWLTHLARHATRTTFSILTETESRSVKSTLRIFDVPIPFFFFFVFLLLRPFCCSSTILSSAIWELSARLRVDINQA